MRRLWSVLCIALALAGCDKKRGITDLQEFTREAHRNKTPQVEPLPALKPAAVFIYTASNLKNPFDQGNLRIQQPSTEDTGGGEEGPDLTRKKEPLEAYAFDGLALVGVVVQDGINWAIINAPDKTVHRVTEGNYAGKNYGEIKLVSANAVDVSELVRNPAGRWEKRTARLVLSE